MDFSDYKKAISKTIEADGIEVSFTYAPSRVITQLSKASSKRIAPFSSLEEFSADEAWKKFDDYGHFLGLSDTVQFADKSQASKIREGFLRVLALLTDEEMQLRIIAQAPRKKRRPSYRKPHRVQLRHGRSVRRCDNLFCRC